MIVTITDEKVKFKKTTTINISAKDIGIFSDSGLLNKNYLIYLNYRTYKIVCPIVKNQNGEITIVVPAFKLPNRNIPIFVHLYAIATYLTANDSMRKVANKVKKLFGLETFSHSTLCRTLKKNDGYT